MIEVVSPFLNHALAYAAHGWAVFPVHGIEGGRCTCGKSNCTKPGKHPRTQHGFKDATTDLEQIRRWWIKWPNANIGIATGTKSGLFVLDVDRKNGKDGEAKLNSLILKHCPLPPTPSVKTGMGRHLYFALTPGISAPSIEGDGLDVRCEGGYVVVPPSRHENGAQYEWTESAIPLAIAPDWIVDYARSGLRRAKVARPASSRARVGDQFNLRADPPAWSQAEETRICSMLAYITAVSYDDWLHVGMILNWLDWGERGFQIWCA
jgi:hypothetical protein